MKDWKSLFPPSSKIISNLYSDIDSRDAETRIVDIANVAEGRLTTESGVPISTSSRTTQGTIYYTPYMGNNISYFNGTNWTVSNFSQITLS